ncbi:uncharacterized protein [Physcomitrium patens]|uniref:Lipoyl-binding domain-containing protein n=2 Tax=Physcomitrium patens TaxID=3218 RepID=A9SAT7_PHYPA|nr:uncharacterized protein LOC112288511 [Physcomitrium patens]PNR45054.1 hypothetical protein PHYPA_014825 [Physcomitrium patens]|eukprot:XP_024388500.1 uncharacterized protein LOC112288511 [Physcomitrella patens]
MALVAGRFVVARSPSLESNALVGNETLRAAAAAPAERIGISAGRPCFAAPLRECSHSRMAAVVRGRRPRALVTEFVTEESEVLDAEEVEEVVEEEEENPLIPSAFEVQNLLMQVCDETSNISEVQMKVGSFSLRVRREIGKPAPAPKPVAAGPPVLGKAMVESIPAEAVPAASKPTSTKLAKKALSGSSLKPVSNFGLIEAAADAGLLFITSPKVGLFRKGRTVKGKSGPPLCEEGQIVKEGQVVCYLEQLGTQQPVEADVTGEVEKVLWEDGVPVGYGDPLIAVKPSFPGIKVKGQLLG